MDNFKVNSAYSLSWWLGGVVIGKSFSYGDDTLTGDRYNI